MALQIWLPLDGNLENQGLANIEIINNGATINDNGKIGKCYSFNGSNNYLRFKYPMSNLINNWSFCCWVKFNQNKTETLISSRKSAGYGMSIFHIGGQLRFDNGTDSAQSQQTFSSTISLNIWQHIAIIQDQTTRKLYINGILVSTINAMPIISGNTAQYILVGASSTSDSTPSANYLNGYLNDLRIYDHALSAREVKELAKGLILHYKLSKPLHTNLLAMKPKSHDAIVYNAYQFNLLENLQGGQTYTMQLWNVDVAHSGKTASQLNVAVYWGGGSVSLFRWEASEFTNGHANYLVKTFTPTSSNASHANAANAWLNIYNSVSNANGTRNLTIGAWKLEKGNTATPFDIGINDSSYIVAGYPENIESDCSGYKRDGIITGTITGNIDTPRYRTCSNFPSGANYINAGRGAMITDAITINFWMKCSTWGNIVSCTERGGWNFEENNGLRFPVYTTDNAYRIAQSSITSASLKNNWHMLTGTYDGLITKIYIDGEEKGSVTGSTTHKNIKYNASNVIFVGAEAGNNASTPASNNYVGGISDFRIYCTALSADDVKALYEDAGYVDKNGNFHAYEYVEI